MGAHLDQFPIYSKFMMADQAGAKTLGEPIRGLAFRIHVSLTPGLNLIAWPVKYSISEASPDR